MAAKRNEGYGRELLDSVASHTAFLLQDLGGLDEDRAKRIGDEVATELAKTWGGQMVYIPMGLFNERLQRNKDIFSEFTGSNHAQLAIKYRLSIPFVYRIIQRMRASSALTD